MKRKQLKRALIKAKKEGWRQVEVQADNLSLIQKIISGNSNDTLLATILDDSLAVCVLLDKCSFPISGRV